jgi:hypothetical protein
MPGCCKRLFVMCLLFPLAVFGQDRTFVNSLVASIDTFNARAPQEKVFIHTDKPYYTTNDTIWMKAYVLDAGLNYSKQSGLLYVELIDDTGKVIIRQAMPLRYGISFGQMVLDDKTVLEGSYTLRAYTNRMQNQGGQNFFTRQVYISSVSNDPWLVSTDSKSADKNMELALLFSKVDKNPVRAREMQLKVMDGGKVLNKDNLQTDFNGKLNVNFNLPGKTKGLTVVAQDLRKGEGNRKLVIPVMVNRPENTDLQFMPEGGQLVAGLACHIAFKAIGEDGLGEDVKGSIVDSKGSVVTPFQSAHKGMGSFELTAGVNESYSAQVNLPGGLVKNYPLPAVKPSGISLHIACLGSDSLSITVSATPDVLNAANRYSLIAQSGGKVCYAANLAFGGQAIHGLISTWRFRSGITRFTLFNAERKPVAERLVFIDHHDALNISIVTGKPAYQPKDSIVLHIKVTDKDNKPVSGSFSLAVTDNSQVKADSTNVPNLQNYMLLTGDLKGNVEGPGFYFDDKNADRVSALDNLLLTQGWVGYDWNDIFNPQYQPKFRAEPEIAVSGQISRVGGKAVAGLPVTLLSTNKPVLMRDTVSDKNGRFVFRNLPKIDTANFIVQVKDKSGRMFEANVDVDEFTPAKVSGLNSIPLTAWYVNSDSTLLHYLDQQRAYNVELDKIKYPAGTRHLKEVVIKGRKIIKGSHFFAGVGAEPDQVLDEADMKKANKMTVQDLLAQKVKGFATTPFPCSSPTPIRLEFSIFCQPVALSIDGVYVDEFYTAHPGYTDHYGYLQSYLYTFTAEDVRGIEVKGNYIEITTWSGGGAFMHRVAGRYLYRPMPISWPKQFYSPKYTPMANNALADLRATVYWGPNIITGADGSATVWFYAKGKAASYTAIVQGSDLSGYTGAGKVKINVK